MEASQSISKCQMEVVRGAADGLKTIRLRGSSDQVAMAKRLVEERVSQWERRERGNSSTMDKVGLQREPM